MEPVRTMEDMNRLLALEQDRKWIMEMIASCSYIIEWLETGRMPGNRRGIERRAGYQREVLTDPSRMQAMQAAARQTESIPSDQEEFRERLERVLGVLTERERDCYVLAHGECFTFAEIAGLLGISKSSVGTYMTRAQRKILLAVEGECRVG
ncbi:sigma-70 family RNA polymerase sigma factor [Cohnella sp. CFH 77786]|nr:sigma-70 family RNA polymerase sigma factor [Cohnella sp. CFH 77786]